MARSRRDCGCGRSGKVDTEVIRLARPLTDAAPLHDAERSGDQVKDDRSGLANRALEIRMAEANDVEFGRVRERAITASANGYTLYRDGVVVSQHDTLGAAMRAAH